MKDDVLFISEKFLSIQGEGQTMGVPAVFLRLGGCNLLCQSKSWICDTIEVWRQSSKVAFHKAITDNLLDALKHGAHLVLTGGEPLLQQKALVRYIEWFEASHGFRPIIEIETNGTIMPDPLMLEFVDFWNCSPKLENSGEPYEKRVKALVINTISKQKNAIFKFVVSGSPDVIDMMQDYGDHIDMKQVVLMPAGESQKKLNQVRQIVAEQAINLGVRYSDRLHIVIWNKKTGV